MPGRRDEVVADSGGMPEWRARWGICVLVGSLCWPVVRTPRWSQVCGRCACPCCRPVRVCGRCACPDAGLWGCAVGALVRMHGCPGWRCGPAVGTPRRSWLAMWPGCWDAHVVPRVRSLGCPDATPVRVAGIARWVSPRGVRGGRGAPVPRWRGSWDAGSWGLRGVRGWRDARNAAAGVAAGQGGWQEMHTAGRGLPPG
jgi:hypothetical protein